MSSDLEKATTFVSRLLYNPAMNDYASLQKEEQILQFLSANAAQLFPTLASPAFFPGRNWNQIFSILVQALYALIGKELAQDLDRIVEEYISLAFISFLGRETVPEAEIRRQLSSFLRELLKLPEARRNFTGPYTVLHYRAVDKYLEYIFERKSYIHFEITKVQRLRMSKEEIKGFVAMTLLLKAAVSVVGGSDAAPNYTDRMAGIIQNSFAEKSVTVLKGKLPALPDQVIESAVHASMSFSENRYIEATARLAAIFSARYRSYKTNVRVDRGADTPDKSWFNIARKNSRFYGFDGKMLDELYKIAAENGW